MFDLLLDALCLLALAGWVTLWLLREKGYFGIVRGAALPRSERVRE